MKVADLLKRVGVTIFFLTVFNAAVIYYFVHGAEHTARVVNYVGRVRGDTQRVLKLDYAGKYNDAAPYTVELDKIILGLQNGDESLGLVKLEDAEFQTLMKAVAAEWEVLKNKIEETKHDPAAFDSFLKISEDYFELTDRAVDSAEAAARNQIILAELILVLVFILQLLALFLLRAITKKRVLKPLNIISNILPRAAGGDLSQRLPMKSTDEFGSIADVFNKLLERQQDFTATLDASVKQKTRELQIKVLEIERSKSKLELEKKQTEILNTENEKFKLAVEGASDHVIIADQNGTLLYANRAAEKITGYKSSEIIGKKAGQVWGGLMSKEYYENFWKTIKIDREPFHGFIKNKRKNGEIYDAAISVSPILNKEGEPIFFVGLERDVTEEMAINRAKSEFVSIASHQLRTPLTVINWYAEILLSEDLGKLNKKQKEYIQEIEDGNKRMISLVNNLLSVSRLELGTFPVIPENADVCKILNEIIKEIKPLAVRKKIAIDVVCPVKKHEMSVDVNLMRFIFQNLLANSIKYTNEGGKISIKMSLSKNDIQFAVADNGLGIPLEAQKNIFTKFFRAANVEKNDTDGTGIGLYIVKSVVNFVGGKVWFESKENAGTTFYLSFPAEGMKEQNLKSKKNNNISYEESK